MPAFSPQPIPPPSSTSALPLDFVLVSFIVAPVRLLSPLSPPHSPLAIVTSFLISMSLVIFCLLFSFVDYVPVKGKIIWYLSLIFLDLSSVLLPLITFSFLKCSLVGFWEPFCPSVFSSYLSDHTLSFVGIFYST